jgi:hypothetical protein
MLIIATVFGDLYSERKTARFFGLSLLILIGSLVLSLLFPASKHRMSITYILITISSMALLFGVFDLLRRRICHVLGSLRTWGENPIVLYIAHLFLLAVFLVPSNPGWHSDAPAWQAVLQGAVFLSVLHLLAVFLSRRKVFIKL